MIDPRDYFAAAVERGHQILTSEGHMSTAVILDASPTTCIGVLRDDITFEKIRDCRSSDLLIHSEKWDAEENVIVGFAKCNVCGCSQIYVRDVTDVEQPLLQVHHQQLIGVDGVRVGAIDWP